MDHDFVIITSSNSTEDNKPYSMFEEMLKWNLKPSTILMNEKDYEDILKWSKE